MWTRALLKQNAKQALSGRYWRCLGITAVVTLLSGGGGVSSAATRGSSSYLESDWSYSLPNSTLLMILLLALVICLISIAWSVFFTPVLQVGLKRYFMENRQSLTPWDTLWSAFRPPFLNIVKVQFLVGLKIFLGCLLIIPGIYWSYCYALVPYLLAENPYMTTERAMELSKQMMEGEKWAYFVLELSFVGWYLLGALCLGIGTLFVNPYAEATYAEFYAAMRSKAFANGLSDSNELGGFVRHEN